MGNQLLPLTCGRSLACRGGDVVGAAGGVAAVGVAREILENELKLDPGVDELGAEADLRPRGGPTGNGGSGGGRADGKRGEQALLV